MKAKKMLITLVLVAIVSGCSSKNTVKEYDKTAEYWYDSITQNITSSNLDKADNYYISLRSEHMRSPLLPTATMMLAQAHIADESYQMADYYIDEYIKKYASNQNLEYAKFLKLKASFLNIKDINKDQKLILDTINDANAFVSRYPSSDYTSSVNTMLVRLHMTQYMLNENIARLYERVGKDRAAQMYRDKNRNSVLRESDIKAPKESYLEKFFN
ncbi:MAG: outer membrane protein assembly factor BamD [Epsilonproteobacteria bacterium]|nr:outer membrane protein assembly factor BamD [Campylobacterota bacterium]